MGSGPVDICPNQPIFYRENTFQCRKSRSNIETDQLVLPLSQQRSFQNGNYSDIEFQLEQLSSSGQICATLNDRENKLEFLDVSLPNDIDPTQGPIPAIYRIKLISVEILNGTNDITSHYRESSHFSQFEIYQCYYLNLISKLFSYIAFTLVTILPQLTLSVIYTS